MYYEYFGLKSAPFSIAPDPSFLYMTSRHQEALAHLYHAVKSDTGFVLLTGEVGTGKTTLCRCFLKDLPENIELAFIINPFLSGRELLENICQEFGIEADFENKTLRSLADLIHTHLLENHAKGLTTILLIDEAQQMGIKALEIIRLLTNLETDTEKLLKVVLVGQPELNDILKKPELRQLAQRITARYHIDALNVQETGDYINYRLRIAGFMHAETLFTKPIVKNLHKMTEGIPRVINLLCDRALLGTYSQNKHRIDKSTLQSAYNEVKGTKTNTEKVGHRYQYLFIFAFVLLTALVSWYLSQWYYSSDSSQVGTVDSFSTLPTELNTLENNLTVAESESISISIRPSTASPPEENNPLAVEDLLYRQQTFALDEMVKWLNLPVESNLKSCDELETLQWRCETLSQASWEKLISINRPTILTLPFDSQNQFVVIVAIGENTVELLHNGASHEVDKSSLASNWQGELTFLWQPPVDFEEYIYFNSSSKAVNWLATAFSILDGQQERLAIDSFTSLLKQRVELFQQEYNLVEDGITGISTLLKINEALGVAKTLESSPKKINESVNVAVLKEKGA